MKLHIIIAGRTVFDMPKEIITPTQHASPFTAMCPQWLGALIPSLPNLNPNVPSVVPQPVLDALSGVWPDIYVGPILDSYLKGISIINIEGELQPFKLFEMSLQSGGTSWLETDGGQVQLQNATSYDPIDQSVPIDGRLELDGNAEDSGILVPHRILTNRQQDSLRADSNPSGALVGPVGYLPEHPGSEWVTNWEWLSNTGIVCKRANISLVANHTQSTNSVNNILEIWNLGPLIPYSFSGGADWNIRATIDIPNYNSATVQTKEQDLFFVWGRPTSDIMAVSNLNTSHAIKYLPQFPVDPIGVDSNAVILPISLIVGYPTPIYTNFTPAESYINASSTGSSTTASIINHQASFRLAYV
jgi:hypothetical protein